MWWWRLFRHGTMMCGYLMPDGGLKQKVFFGVWRWKSENWDGEDETMWQLSENHWSNVGRLGVGLGRGCRLAILLDGLWGVPYIGLQVGFTQMSPFIEHWTHHNWTLSFIFNCMLMSIFLYLDNWVLNTNILNFLPKVPQQWPRLPLPLWLYRWGNTVRVVSTICKIMISIFKIIIISIISQ